MRQAGRQQVLIVDDDPTSIKILVDTLKEEFALTVATSGGEALEMVGEDGPPDLILLDVIMPEIDGYEVCRRLKSESRTRNTPIIFITSRIDEEDEAAGFAFGAVDYITKPISPALVKARIRTQLELKSHRDRLEDLVEERTLDLVKANEQLKSEIEERKFVEKALIESEDRYRSTLNYTITSTLIFEEDLVISAVNPEFEKLSGYTRNEVEGRMKLTDFIALEALEKMLAHLPEKEETADGRTAEFEYTFADKKGSNKDILFKIGLIPGTRRSIASLVDITSHKAAEKELRERAGHLRKENIRLKSSIKERYRFGELVGKSQAMQKVYRQIIDAAANDISIIIYGESGTGKELVAKAIHDLSDRRNKRFITVNCGAIPVHLLESEFFGYRKGAFTGATTSKPGYLDLADGGTIFLDEIAELDLNMQTKLLRALESGGYTPIGGSSLKKPDVRVVAATNKDLMDQVRKSLMREDFFYRIHIVPIKLPPLRERKEDLPLLIDHFLRTAAGHKEPPPLTGKVLQALMDYDWPGNVRELQNVLLRYLAVSKLDFLSGFQADSDEDSLGLETPEEGSRELRAVLGDFEKSYIKRLLKQHKGNRTKVAALLGIDRRTLLRKIRRHKII